MKILHTKYIVNDDTINNNLLIIKLEDGVFYLERGDENYEVDDNNRDFVVLDCGEYKLMVSNWEGDSSNYGEAVTWDNVQKWVDDNCNKVKLGGFSDWVVPTIDELNLMYENKSKFTGKDMFTANGYWSSSEDSTTNAWRQYFDDGYQSSTNKTYYNRVRGVRRIFPLLTLNFRF